MAIPRKVHVGSFKILEQMGEALVRFSGRIPDVMDKATHCVDDALEEIEGFCQSLENQLRECEYRYDTADDEDDDTGYLACQRDEVQEKLLEARRLQQAAIQSAERFYSSVRRLQIVVDESVPSARETLKCKAEQLTVYFNVQPPADMTYSTQPTAHSGAARENNLLDMKRVSQEDINSIHLPIGFSWLPIDAIAPKELADLPTTQDFRKVSYSEIKLGFSVLEGEVLPVLKDSNGVATRDSFEDRPESDGHEGPSAKKIFSVFFDKSIPEHIRVERFAKGTKYADSTSGGFQIVNGRHRIKVAKDLGWKYVPAEIVEV